MCGICGYINLNQTSQINDNTIVKMANRMEHRGPDDIGHYSENSFSLAMRRLSIIDTENGNQPIYSDDKKIVIIQIMLRLFMGLSLDDPFSVTKNFLQREKLGVTCNAILIDMHGEATSEKNAYGHYFDGKVSAILGTHTHVPTSDSRILDAGTAYQTDVGMTGDYNSVIGMEKENPIHGFIKGYRSEGRFVPAGDKITICGTFIETDNSTGLSKKIVPFQI